MCRVIIIEDEFQYMQMLRENLMQHFPEFEIVAECSNAEDALSEVLRLQPDLLFLDINMPGKGGFWLADELVQLENDVFTHPDIIFTTSYTYSDYLLKALEMAAIDYLVKPIGIAELAKAVKLYRRRSLNTLKLKKLIDDHNEDTLMKFKSYNGLFLLHPDDITYVKADRDYAIMFFSNGSKEEIFERLGEIEKKLPPEIFFRAGKSIIVNLRYIRKITDTTLLLVTPFVNWTVNISRNASRQLKERL